MKWETISKYCLKSGNWTISKSLVAEETKYLLWHCGEIIGLFTNLEEAKEYANER